MKRVLSLLLILLCLTACTQARPTPLQPRPAGEPLPVLAFFGTSTHGWNESLTRAVRDWAGENGWALVEYDCLGLESTMDLQVADLLRAGGAKLAVLCTAAGDAESMERWTRELTRAGATVIAVDDGTGRKAPEGAAGRIAPADDALLAAAAGYFKEALPPRSGVVILHDVEDAPLESDAAKALERAGVSVRGRTYTWGRVDYARDLLADTLKSAGAVGGVLCFSRTGAEGAEAALEKLGRRDVKVLCLDDTSALRAALETGRVDALVAVSPQAAADGLKEALDQAAKGEKPGHLPLDADLITAED